MKKQSQKSSLDSLVQAIPQFMFWLIIMSIIDICGLKEITSIALGLVFGVIMALKNKHKHLGTGFCILYGVLSFSQYALNSIFALCDICSGNLPEKIFLFSALYLFKQYTIDIFSKDKLSERDKIFYVFAIIAIVASCIHAAEIQKSTDALIDMISLSTVPQSPLSTCASIDINIITIGIKNIITLFPYAVLTFFLAAFMDKKTVDYLFTKNLLIDLNIKLRETHFGNIYKFQRRIANLI